uniref:CPW-WPC domain-containing protein n=1 Tax=viral metagenome TaxID=1070528 RepID=A0A6C0JKE3_9ZZZZ
MDLFYIIVLIIAIVVLIIVLTIIGFGMKYHNGSGDTWPPVAATCPDYWNIDNVGKCIIPELDTSQPKKAPRNTGSIYVPDSSNSGNLKLNTEINKITGYDLYKINFSDPYYTDCNKKSWANTYSIYWDGYSNFNGCK